MVERITFSCPEELADELNSRFSFGDNRSEFICEALRAYLDATAENDESESDDSVRQQLCDVDFPESRDRDACVDAVLAAREYLRTHGPASMREIVTTVMPDHPVGYDVPELEPGDRYRGAWWRKVVKPGLEALDDVEKPRRGGSEWSAE